MRILHHGVVGALGIVAVACSARSSARPPASTTSTLDPTTAPKVPIDRFSDAAAHLWMRSVVPGLPAANAPIDFDDPKLPFLIHGLGPVGEHLDYYNFDVQSETPAQLYRFTRGDGSAIPMQLDIVDVLPGQGGYSDFWQINEVTVADDYIANTITSLGALNAADLPTVSTTLFTNSVMVPDGSSATLRIRNESPALVQGWYRDQVVAFLRFDEETYSLIRGKVPTAPIYVTYKKNPDPADNTSGALSGVELDAHGRSHNVVFELPGASWYSPLWAVTIYDDRDFGTVKDLPTAAKARVVSRERVTVNGPVVAVDAGD
jgi:hypothetical protein